MEFVAFMKEKSRLTNGCLVKCSECKFSSFHNGTDYPCETFMFKRPKEAERILQEWVEEDRLAIDWTKVPVDTLIEVYTSMGWTNRYFAKYENGKIYTWLNGATSKTTNTDQEWQKARLVKEEE